jgi:predicted Zn-dependent protease
LRTSKQNNRNRQPFAKMISVPGKGPRLAQANAFVRILSLLLIPALLAPRDVMAHGDLSERIGELKAGVAQHPEDGSLRLSLAGLYFQNENFEEALAVLAALDRLAPGKFPTGKLRGSALLALRRPAEAREALDRFLARFPGDPQATLYRARALAALSVTGEALSAYREALQRTVTPEPDLFQEAAAALSAAGCKEEALSVLERGLKALGPIPSLAQCALDLELALKRFDAALTRVDSMRRASPRPEQWMAKRAAILTTAGRIGESRAAWQALIAHLDALPAQDRSSHAMSRLAEQARNGVKSLQSLAGIETAPHPSNSGKSLSPSKL